MRLITYLPIPRIGDIEEYQYDNVLFKNIYVSGLPKLIATRYLLSAITHL
jgi:hypothetical protein